MSRQAGYHTEFQPRSCFDEPCSKSVLALYATLLRNNLTSQRFISWSLYRALNPDSSRAQNMGNLGVSTLNHQDRKERGFHVATLAMMLWPTSGKVMMPKFQWLSVVAY